MDLAQAELFLCGLSPMIDSRLRILMPTPCKRRCLSRLLSARFDRIDPDPRLAAVDEFDAGGFERPLHGGERALVRRSRKTFEIRDRFCRDLAGIR
jgi:hypothetical protein